MSVGKTASRSSSRESGRLLPSSFGKVDTLVLFSRYRSLLASHSNSCSRLCSSSGRRVGMLRAAENRPGSSWHVPNTKCASWLSDKDGRYLDEVLVVNSGSSYLRILSLSSQLKFTCPLLLQSFLPFHKAEL